MASVGGLWVSIKLLSNQLQTGPLRGSGEGAVIRTDGNKPAAFSTLDLNQSFLNVPREKKSVT